MTYLPHFPARPDPIKGRWNMAKTKRTPTPAGKPTKAPRPAADLPGQLLDLLNREDLGCFRNSTAPLVWEVCGHPHYGVLCLDVGDKLAEAFKAGLFAGQRFAELRSRIAAHVDRGDPYMVTVGVVAWLRQRGHEIAGGWQENIAQIADALGRELAKAKSGKPRRRRKAKSLLPLTTWQRRVLEVVGKCGGIAAAAQLLNRDPKTIREVHRAALAKLPADLATPRPKGKVRTRPILEDDRGQALVAGQDDGPAAGVGPRANVPRDGRGG